MRVLITGGAGFVEGHVAEYYARKGYEVVVFDNLSRAELLGHETNMMYNWNYLKRYENVELKILVTGGAGFIGSHLVDALADKHEIVVLDSLEPQVHASKPDYLNPDASYIFGDMRDEEVLRKALEGVEVIFHLASAVGVGQSMYEIRRVHYPFFERLYILLLRGSLAYRWKSF